MGVGSLSSLSRAAAGSPRDTQGLQGLQGATVARVEVGREREGPGAAGAKPHQRDGKPGGKPGWNPDEKGGDSVASPAGEDSDPS